MECEDTLQPRENRELPVVHITNVDPVLITSRLRTLHPRVLLDDLETQAQAPLVAPSLHGDVLYLSVLSGIETGSSLRARML